MPDDDRNDDKYDQAETVQNIAQGLIPNFHPELANAKIDYLFTNKTPKKSGRPLLGKAALVSGRWKYMTGLDFVIEVSRDPWEQDLTGDQRTALVDHLLERCSAVEDEKTGEFKWLIREPDVHEFSTILQRHQAWNESLEGFCQVAQKVDISAIVDEELGEDETLAEDLTVDEDED